MERIVTGAQMKELDAYTIQEIGVPSLVLMERAGMAVFEAMKAEKFPLERVLLLCGAGNNGADGVVIARLLVLAGYRADVCILGNPEHFTKEMQKQIDIAEKYGISFVKNIRWDEYTSVVDAIFGVGLSREVSGRYKEVIEQINVFRGKVAAVDIPSGIHADTGRIMGCAVKAHLTVTFAYKKSGLCLYPGAACAGKVVTADIGIYKQKQTTLKPELFACTKSDLKQIKRQADANKGTFGKILLIAGSRDIFGAAYLSGLAAMKTGAGMLKICTREENKALFSCFPEAMLLTYKEETDLRDMLKQGFDWADVIGIGPGIGTSSQADALLQIVLAEGTKPLVIDADGINLLKNHKEELKNYAGDVILTPHLGEFSRFTGLSVGKWKENPLEITEQTAKMSETVLVCKDARTIICRRDGKICINLTGNDAMATAGSGDVLTGIILGLLAQKKDADTAACLGVYLHGLAGERASKRKGRAGLLASDIIEETAQILREAE